MILKENLIGKFKKINKSRKESDVNFSSGFEEFRKSAEKKLNDVKIFFNFSIQMLRKQITQIVAASL